MIVITTLLICLVGQLPDNRELGEGNQPVDVEKIQYTITLDLGEYRPVQDIIVRSTIKNIGESTIRVPEPSEKASYVGFSVGRKNDNGLEVVRDFPEIGINPLWNAYIVTLAPGESATLSSELFVGGAAGLAVGFDPGEYVFRARYYPDRTPRDTVPFVDSNSVSFRVRPHSPQEEEEYRELLKASADVNLRSIYDGKSARAFLQKYPHSIYRSRANGLLAEGRFYLKDWTSLPEFQRLERESLHSDTFTDVSYYAEATSLLQAGDPAAAVKLLRETNLANSRALREDLEAKYGPFVDPEPAPPTPPAPIPSPPQNTIWIWLLSGIIAGIAVLILMNFKRRSRRKR